MNNEHEHYLTQRALKQDKLQTLFEERRNAQNSVTIARSHLEAALAHQRVAELRYQRQALWIRADELRHQLAEVENAVARIQKEAV
jgi:hypothetical protein